MFKKFLLFVFLSTVQTSFGATGKSNDFDEIVKICSEFTVEMEEIWHDQVNRICNVNTLKQLASEMRKGFGFTVDTNLIDSALDTKFFSLFPEMQKLVVSGLNIFAYVPAEGLLHLSKLKHLTLNSHGEDDGQETNQLEYYKELSQSDVGRGLETIIIDHPSWLQYGGRVKGMFPNAKVDYAR